MIPLTLKKIADHYLVPKHEIVPKEKHEEVLKAYGLDEYKLPKIFKDDAIVEEIDAKKGDILKITRDSVTAGKSVFFRLVV